MSSIVRITSICPLPKMLPDHALVNLVPNLGMLEPLFKACEKDPNARRTLVEGFTGDAPIYGLLKHPRTLATALRDGLGEAVRF